MICICIVHKNCIIVISILHFILKKNVWNFCFFETFLFFSWKWKYKKTWLLYVTSNKGFLKFSTAKITKQNKEYVWILWSFWIVICLNWRSETVIRNFIVAMFLSVSYDYIFKYCSSCTTLHYVINLHDACLSKKIMVCMMYAFLNRPVYTRRIKFGK